MTKPKPRPPGSGRRPKKPISKAQIIRERAARENKFAGFLEVIAADKAKAKVASPDDQGVIKPIERQFEHHTEDTELPHLSGFKFYHWSRTFYESQNKMNLLTAANQIGKSLTQIRKCIHWATEKSLWPKLWRSKPMAFFYLYPDRPLFEVEYNSKWKQQLLPRGKMKNDKKYGWEEITDRGKVIGLKFNSGIYLWFKTYSQKVSALQGATLHAVFCDEELNPRYFPELQARLNDTGGYFHQCFTATSGHELWRQAMNPGRGDKETFPDALKQTVSLYDCITFEDGSPGRYTDERIEEIKRQCGTEMEIRRRVYGEFVNEEGLKYPSFDVDRHYVKPFAIDQTYSIYVGVDMGSGLRNHPASIVFVAVNNDFNKAYVFKGWRGDHVETTASDVMDKFLQMKEGLRPVSQVYDFSSKEFGIIASRIGEPFLRAEKSRDLGAETINTLFKSDMLFIFDTEELQKLGGELMTLRNATAKTVAKDDLTDGLRYSIMQIPWDWSCIVSADMAKLSEEPKIPERPKTPQELLAEEIAERRRAFAPRESDGSDLSEEVGFWNELAGT